MNYLPTFTFQEGSYFATYIDTYKYLSQKVAKNAHIYDIIMKMKKKYYLVLTTKKCSPIPKNNFNLKLIFYWYFSVASSAESGSGFMQGSTASTQIVIKPIEKLKIWPGVVKRYQAFKEGDFIVE